MLIAIITVSILFLSGCESSHSTFTPEADYSPYRENSPVHLNYIILNIDSEEEMYVTQFVLPSQAPYVMEIDINAETNSNIHQRIDWLTNREYTISECGDYEEECPYSFDLMSDSTTYTDKYGISLNTIRVSPEFANDTITVYSYLTSKDGRHYRGTMKLFLIW